MYRAPLRQLRFGLGNCWTAAALPRPHSWLTTPTSWRARCFEEAGRFAETVSAPEPSRRRGRCALDARGATAPGFRDAYQQFTAGGWPALGGPPEFGGQPMPLAMVTVVGEIGGRPTWP